MFAAGAVRRQKVLENLVKHKQNQRFLSTPAGAQSGATRFGKQHLVGVRGGSGPASKVLKNLVKPKQNHRFLSTPAGPQSGATRFGKQHLVGVRGGSGPASKSIEKPCKTQAKSKVSVNPRRSADWSYQVWQATPGRCSRRERSGVKKYRKTL